MRNKLPDFFRLKPLWIGAFIVTMYSGTSIFAGSQLYTSADSACPGEIVSAYIYPESSQTNWSFGDGFTSTQPNPSHAYSIPNTYLLRCIYYNSSTGKNDTVKQNIVIINNAKPSAKFNTTTSACPGDLIRFYPRNLNAVTYSWAFGDGGISTQPQPTYFYSSPGNYPVTLTITSSCGQTGIYTDTIRVKNNVRFNSGVSINSSTVKSCPSDPVAFFFNYNISPASQVWKFGTGDSSILLNPTYSFSALGTYTVTVTAKNGCNIDTTLSRIISVGTANRWSSSIDYEVSPASVCPGDKVSYNVYTPAKSYSWNFGDATTSSSTNGQHTYSSANTYTVSLKLTNNCNIDTTVFNTVSVVNNLTPTVTHTGNNNNWGSTQFNACTGDSVLFYATGGSHYIFDFGDGTTATQTKPFNVPGFGVIDMVKHAYSATGTRKVIITYFNGCNKSAKDSLDILIGTGQPVLGGIFDLGNNFSACSPVPFLAAGGNSFEWNFGDGNTLTTAQPAINHTYLTPGSYNVSVKITNACGNSSIYVTTIDIKSMTISATTSSVTCYGGANGSITFNVINGTPPYTYSLDGGAYQASNIFTGLTAVVHTVDVKDANGCIETHSAAVSQPAAIFITPSSINTACGASTGSASATATGGTGSLTYTWSNGSTSPTASNLSAGIYSVTVKDANTCTKTEGISVSNTTGPVVNVNSVTSNSCKGSCNASASVSATGVATLTYSWNSVPPQFTANTSNTLCAGIYVVVVTDGNGCMSAVSATVTEPAAIAIVATETNSACAGGNGSATLTVTGGTGSYSYSWTTGSTSPTQNNLSAGSYTVTVVDANICSKTAKIVISEPDPLVVSIASVSDASCKGNDGSVAAAANGGTPLYVYTWSMGKVGSTINGLSAGGFTVTVTDNNGCTSTTNGTVTADPPFVPTITQNGNQLTGSTAVQYQWNLNGSPISGATSQIYVATQTGNYTVTETNANGCTGTSAITVITITGIVSQPELSAIDIYPNPNNGSFNLILNADKSERINIIVTDVTGKLVFDDLLNISAGKNSYLINLSENPNGFYSLRLISGGGVINKKIVVQ